MGGLWTQAAHSTHECPFKSEPIARFAGLWSGRIRKHNALDETMPSCYRAPGRISLPLIKIIHQLDRPLCPGKDHLSLDKATSCSSQQLGETLIKVDLALCNRPLSGWRQ